MCAATTEALQAKARALQQRSHRNGKSAPCNREVTAVGNPHTATEKSPQWEIRTCNREVTAVGNPHPATEKSPQLEIRTPQRTVTPARHNWRKLAFSKEDQYSQK